MNDADSKSTGARDDCDHLNCLMRERISELIFRMDVFELKRIEAKSELSNRIIPSLAVLTRQPFFNVLESGSYSCVMLLFFFRVGRLERSD